MADRQQKSSSGCGQAAERVLKRLDWRLFPRGDRGWSLLREWMLPDCRSVLDVGCGDRASLIKLVPGIPYSVGVDASIPDQGSDPEVHSEYKTMDIRLLANEFAPTSFDCVVALDVIEHLSKEDGIRLLEAMESIASRNVILLTPNGFLPQPPALDNPFQEHLSGWTVDEFVERGYRVVGINGWRPLRGSYAAIRWRPASFWWRLALLTQRFVSSRPRWAFHLLCLKDVGTAQGSTDP